jgi:hypothetical protein
LVSVTIDIPVALRQAFKEYCVRLNLSMRRIGCQAIREYMVNHPPERQPQPPPTATESWGT